MANDSVAGIFGNRGVELLQRVRNRNPQMEGQRGNEGHSKTLRLLQEESPAQQRSIFRDAAGLPRAVAPEDTQTQDAQPCGCDHAHLSEEALALLARHG